MPGRTNSGRMKSAGAAPSRGPGRGAAGGAEPARADGREAGGRVSSAWRMVPGSGRTSVSVQAAGRFVWTNSGRDGIRRGHPRRPGRRAGMRAVVGRRAGRVGRGRRDAAADGRCRRPAGRRMRGGRVPPAAAGRPGRGCRRSREQVPTVVATEPVEEAQPARPVVGDVRVPRLVAEGPPAAAAGHGEPDGGACPSSAGRTRSLLVRRPALDSPDAAGVRFTLGFAVNDARDGRAGK